SPFRYYIDSRSLSYNPIDGVVRYTLVIRSSKGGENVAFEGMRCNAREYKVYALGNGRGKLRPHPNPRWKMIAETGYTRYRTDLARNYLCSAKLETMDREQILRNIRYGLDSKDTLYH
ncbi:MAG: CNP1-like family protein, partial [Sedimenticola sp.]